MNRKELYAKVKELNLQEEIKNKYGDNYTRVTSEKLAAIIAKHTVSKVEKKFKVVNKITKVDKLIKVLKDKHILLNSEISYINS